MNDFTHTTLGRTGLPVHRLGLSASHWPGKKAIHRALDHGLNYFFLYGFDLQMVRVMRDLPAADRERCVIVTGAYNYVFSRQNLERTLHKRLRQLRTDQIDIFLFLGIMKGKEFPEAVRDELVRLRETGKARHVGVSIHDRKFAGRLAAEGDLDVLMIRYNAAHRGAEQDIFLHVTEHDPGIVSYTATRWRRLLYRPRGWPKDAFRPTAGQTYRFVLSNPHVHVCMTAPSNMKQLEENLAALEDGPLSEEEMAQMQEFGDVVHERRGWFMGG
jgi:aryl-alcohol dehydrogenase-like predicted oxidoreductase